MIEKALPTEHFRIAFSKHQKTLYNRRKMCFSKMQKFLSKYVIKPVVYEDFWRHFQDLASKTIQKALGFPLKVEAVSDFCKTVGNR